MKILRTRFSKDIVAEFIVPTKSSKKVIIFLSGAPSVPKLGSVLEFYAKKGFWVFHPRYRGSWESDGSFLQKSPERDVLDIINQLPKGFLDVATGKEYNVAFETCYLFGSSFGGPASILASRDKRVTKVVALSPVIDWLHPSKLEPLDQMPAYIKKAYGQGYRMRVADFKKLQSGTFYNPINHIKEIDGNKILLFHAKDDEVVGYKPSELFCKKIKADLVLLKKGGHLGSRRFIEKKFYTKIKQFLK